MRNYGRVLKISGGPTLIRENGKWSLPQDSVADVNISQHQWEAAIAIVDLAPEAKIPGIKTLRKIFGFSLIEAKDVWEAARSQYIPF